MIGLPPLIIQKFRKDLLTIKCPKFREDSEDLNIIYKHILHLIRKKGHFSPIRVEKTQKLLQEYLELYERIKAKEEEEKTASKNNNQRLFYYFPSIKGQGEKIFRRLTLRKWNLQTGSAE